MSKTFLLVLGEGGHSQEILRLTELLGPDYRYCYILVRDDEVSAAKITRSGPAYRVIRPRNKTHNLVLDALKMVVCGLQALAILLRCWPDAIIATGPSVAVPVCMASKLLHRKVIFIETGSRIHALSMTGHVICGFAKRPSSHHNEDGPHGQPGIIPRFKSQIRDGAPNAPP